MTMATLINKNSFGACIKGQTFSQPISWRETWRYLGRCDAGEGAERVLCLDQQATERATQGLP